MTEEEKIKNIVAFLSILFDKSDIWNEHIMNFTPDYLMEKFERYIISTQNESDWGLHPSVRHRVFNRYLDKWGIQKTDWHEIG